MKTNITIFQPISPTLPLGGQFTSAAGVSLLRQTLVVELGLIDLAHGYFFATIKT